MTALMRPAIDKRKCPAQKDICQAITACSTGAIYYIEDDAEPLGGKIEILDALCNACGLCVTACCGGAIIMIADGVQGIGG
jgi:ferredoxin